MASDAPSDTFSTLHKSRVTSHECGRILPIYLGRCNSLHNIEQFKKEVHSHLSRAIGEGYITIMVNITWMRRWKMVTIGLRCWRAIPLGRKFHLSDPTRMDEWKSISTTKWGELGSGDILLLFLGIVEVWVWPLLFGETLVLVMDGMLLSELFCVRLLGGKWRLFLCILELYLMNGDKALERQGMPAGIRNICRAGQILINIDPWDIYSEQFDKSTWEQE